MAGYHIYRSTDGEHWVPVTTQMIPATGNPLGQYTLLDPLELRRLKAGRLRYRVEAVMVDGGRETYGPYEVRAKDLAPRGRARGRRR